MLTYRLCLRGADGCSDPCTNLSISLLRAFLLTIFGAMNKSIDREKPARGTTSHTKGVVANLAWAGSRPTKSNFDAASLTLIVLFSAAGRSSALSATSFPVRLEFGTKRQRRPWCKQVCASIAAPTAMILGCEFLIAVDVAR
ncbi:hypothetical protein QA640_06590 [Bradyrhizobium sp. CB82]|uniref:hypothetical protein n=1 Tax=Bradyrhizobium sp. CB82 TaxID=3039159 RepID=UPI0024B089B6|nr:hypothetical protein [Bradyrhizobium sp. CB82]WFU42145.1 hypothetical protein QA640_06590 [Bradyrhizobium sp. CB82]